MTNTMFDTLLTMPLFQGLSHSDITNILESTHLDFRRAKPDTILAEENSTCNSLLFIFNGVISMKTYVANRSWYVEEELHAPLMIGLDALFSPTLYYRSTYTTLSPVRYFQIEKRNVHDLAEKYEVVRLNIINSLSVTIHRKNALHWLPAQETLEKRIIKFFRDHVSYPAGRKIFHLSLKTLGLYLGRDQRYISASLKKLESQGLVFMKNRCYEIPHFEKLWQTL